MARSYTYNPTNQKTGFPDFTNVCLTSFYPVLPRLLPTTNNTSLKNKDWHLQKLAQRQIATWKTCHLNTITIKGGNKNVICKNLDE